jgi:septum formation protein
VGKISKKLILASQSPRRRELLAQLQVNFEAGIPDYVEMTRPDISPEQEVIALARGKAESLKARFPKDLILGCDTLVVLGNKKLGKPADDSEALQMLRNLSGKTHRVLTGLHLLDSESGKSWEALEGTRVKMRSFSDQEARNYVATGEPLDKAGAYGIQGKGGHLVESIEGDFFNVVGLPLKRLSELLEKVAIKIPIDLEEIYRGIFR